MRQISNAKLWSSYDWEALDLGKQTEQCLQLFLENKVEFTKGSLTQDRIFIIKLNICQDQNVNLAKHNKLNNIKLNKFSTDIFKHLKGKVA